MRRLGIFLLVLAAAGTAKDKKKDPAEIGNRDVGKGINFYSLEKEIALGKQLAQEVARQARLVEDPIISEYINRVGQNLARNSDAKVPVSIQVLEGEELNAFAFPGGFIFVNTGLIKAAETEAELAGAMAHEIAHVAARHMTRQATRGQIANLLSLPLLVIGGWTGYAARQGASMAIPMTFLSFGRAFESEADFLGLQYLYAAGYDPNGAIDIFEKLASLERRKPGVMAKVFATHPMNAERLQKAQQEIQEILPGRPEYVVNTSQYVEVRERLLALESRRKVKGDQQDPGKPRLRRGPAAPLPEPDENRRPTIHRRELID